MKINRAFCTILCAVIIFVCLPFYAEAQIIPDGAEYVANQVVFEYSGSYKDAYNTFVISHPELGITKLTEKPDFGAETSTLVADIDSDVEKLCKVLKNADGVNYAEPNYVYKTDSFTMPVEITNQTLNFNSYEKWYLKDVMNIPAAWQKYEKTGENVVVAIIDNGFNLNAYEFPTNLWSDSSGNHGWNTHTNTNDISPIYGYIKTVDDNGNATYETETDASGNTVYKLGPLSDSSHGSNVAGIIGMPANNNAGFIGAAYNAKLMLINAAQYKPFAESTSFDAADVATAVRYATSHGADIINMSLGATLYAQSIKNAVDAAYNAGIAVIAAAGNGDGSGTYAYPTSDAKYYPAASENVIGVMAIDKTDPTQLAAFSNYDTIGGCYDIAAPGVNIIGCHCESGKYSVNSGTSQACPLVSACAAIYLSVYPDATASDLYDAIRNSSTKTVTSNKTSVGSNYTFKSLDAVMLLDYGEVKPELIFNLDTTVTHDSERGYIYGLDENFTSISQYISVKSGTGTLQFTPTPLGNGTGSIVSVFKTDGTLYKNYIVIIFGDVNGDCRADGQDTVIISCIINKMTDYPDYTSFAADLDFNDTLDDEDLKFSFGYPLKNEFIFQTR